MIRFFPQEIFKGVEFFFVLILVAKPVLQTKNKVSNFLHAYIALIT